MLSIMLPSSHIGFKMYWFLISVYTSQLHHLNHKPWHPLHKPIIYIKKKKEDFASNFSSVKYLLTFIMTIYVIFLFI